MFTVRRNQPITDEGFKQLEYWVKAGLACYTKLTIQKPELMAKDPNIIYLNNALKISASVDRKSLKERLQLLLLDREIESRSHLNDQTKLTQQIKYLQQMLAEANGKLTEPHLKFKILKDILIQKFHDHYETYGHAALPEQLNKHPIHHPIQRIVGLILQKIDKHYPGELNATVTKVINAIQAPAIEEYKIFKKLLDAQQKVADESHAMSLHLGIITPPSLR